jgi:YNFM family putative membrane transporter
VRSCSLASRLRRATTSAAAPGATTAIFLVYSMGSVSSALAGRLADRFGRRRVPPAAVLIAGGGVAVTALHPLPVVITGIALLTIGVLGAHSVASGWVGRRARSAHAQASGLYLLACYGGSSIAGPVGGAAWSIGGWRDVTALATALLGIALFVALRMRATAPVRPAIA